jgi:hypothetical protein
MEVNMTAPFLFIQAVLPVMKSALRPHRQRLVHRGADSEHARRSALYSVEGGLARPDARGARSPEIRHHGQRDLSRDDRHGADAGDGIV